MRISDWSSDVCSSDLQHREAPHSGADSARGASQPQDRFAEQHQIGRASCRESVSVRVDLGGRRIIKKKKKKKNANYTTVPRFVINTTTSIDIINKSLNLTMTPRYT